MDEEKLILEIIALIIDLYDDYSDLAFEEVCKEVQRKLRLIRSSFQELVEVPKHVEVLELELVLDWSESVSDARFHYLEYRDRNEQSQMHGHSFQLEKVIPIISAVLNRSSDNQLVIIICDKLLNLLELYDLTLSGEEERLLKLITQSLKHEYYYQTMSKNTSSDKPMRLHFENSIAEQFYKSLLIRVLTISDKESRSIDETINSISQIMINSYKKTVGLCYFYEIESSIEFNKLFIEFVEVFCVEESKELEILIKQYFNKHPVLPELVNYLENHEDTIESFKRHHESTPIPMRQVEHLDTDLNKIQTLLSTISNAFKNYELYERELEEPGLVKLKKSYFEFKFPDIFKLYVDILTDTIGTRRLQEDPYFRLVASEVLKYEGDEINHDCWDLQLHKLCKIMFGAATNYDKLVTTAYHKLAVYTYAQNQSMKRKYLKTWYKLSVSKYENNVLLSLFDKAIKKRTMAKLVNEFIRRKSLELQSVKYSSACVRNLAFGKWVNSYQRHHYSDILSDQFIMSKYLRLWRSEARHDLLVEKCQIHELQFKRKFFMKVVNRYREIQNFQRKADSFVLDKYVQKLTYQRGKFDKAIKSHELKMKKNHFKSWKHSLILIAVGEVVKSKNSQICRKWFFTFWSQRYLEHNLCNQFKAVREIQLSKNYLYSMLLASSNNKLSRDFYNRNLLVKYSNRIKLEMKLKLLEKQRNSMICQKYFNKLRLNTRLSLHTHSTESVILKRTFNNWRRKLKSRTEDRDAELEELANIAKVNFTNSQQKIYLKFFMYNWEDATIKSLEKQNELAKIYEHTVVERYTGPFFMKWRSEFSRIKKMELRALSFEKEITLVDYLGVLLDRSQQIEYMELLAEEWLHMSGLTLLLDAIKKWTFKLLKVKNNSRLLEEFRRRSESTVLKNFMLLWKDATLAKRENALNPISPDDSFAQNSMMYSPLLHRRVRRSPSRISLAGTTNIPASTPLIDRGNTSISPKKKILVDSTTRKAIHTPFRSRVNRKFSPLTISTLNSENFRKNQVLEFKSRFQGLKLTPTSVTAIQSSTPRYIDDSIPPAQPNFREAVRNGEGHTSVATSLGSLSDVFQTSGLSDNLNRILLNEDEEYLHSSSGISTPKVRRRRNLLLNREDAMTRNSSFTAVDRSVDDEENDPYMGPFVDSQIRLHGLHESTDNSIKHQSLVS